MRRDTKLLALTALLALLLAMVPRPALAADVRQGEAVRLGAGEVVDDDLYAFASTVTILGTVNGDLVVAGSTILIDGPVHGDLMVAGSTVTINGAVDGSVRAAGGTVAVNGAVGGDVLLAGGSLTLGPSARVGRDLLIGGTASVAAPVTRNVLAGGEALLLSAPVGGDVRAQAVQVTLAEGASIGGGLYYTSDQDARIAAGTAIGGPVQRTAANWNADEARRDPTAPIFGWLRWLVGLALFGLAFVLGLPRFSGDSAAALRASPGVSFALGAAALFGVPVVALLVFGIGLLVGGWWLGLIVLGLYAVALGLGAIVAADVAGAWLLTRAGQPARHPAWALLLGVLLLAALTAVPAIGGWVGLVASLFGLGALMTALVRDRGTVEPATPLRPAGAGPTLPALRGGIAGD